MTLLIGFIFLFEGLMLSPAALAADFADPGTAAQTPVPGASAAPSALQKIDVNGLKQRYWRSNTPELEVIQNRSFTKAGRLNFEAFALSMSHDPFLSTSGIGLSLGMYFTENLGFHLMYWRVFDTSSAATTTLLADEVAAKTGSLYYPNTNPIFSAYAADLCWSVLYGKLSLLGKAILHFDLFVLGGAAALNTTTQNGTSVAPYLGLGEQMYLTHYLALRADFRLLYYSENVYESNNVVGQGTAIGRTVLAPTVSIGVSAFVFNLF